MRFKFLKSFDRTISKLDTRTSKKASLAIDKIIDFLEKGEKSSGLGLKKLRKNYWEIRADARTRILMTIEKDLTTFVISGNHDQIAKYLKEN